MRRALLPQVDLLRGLSKLGLGLIFLSTAARAAGSTAIAACGTISAPGNYVVTNNLTASGNCLTLTVSNVAIDLKGHKIQGDGTGGGITDGGNSIAYIIVANGKITNFATGIDLTTDTDQTSDLLLNVNVSGNTADGINIGGRDNNLSNVTASNNGGNGVVLGNCCDSLSNITTNGNGSDGVHFQAEDYLLNVTSNGNNGDGVSGGHDSSMTNSVTNKNGGNGVEFGGTSLVVSSVANANQVDGFHLLGSFNQVTDSKAGKNQGDGIDFQDDSGLATSVITKHNAADGVHLVCPGSAVRVSASGNATNLSEDSSGGACTNVRNNAP